MVIAQKWVITGYLTQNMPVNWTSYQDMTREYVEISVYNGYEKIKHFKAFFLDVETQTHSHLKCIKIYLTNLQIRNIKVKKYVELILI